MFRLISFENCADNLTPVINSMRQRFAVVFARHYTDILLLALQKKDLDVLDGFKDLITKRFDGDLTKYSEEEILSILTKLYMGPGFSDECAFIKGFGGMESSKLSARAFYADRAHTLTEDECTEINDYISVYEKDGRELKEVNFVAMVNSRNEVHAFCIYHVFEKDKKQILHVRQAASRFKKSGFAKTMTQYLADLYPDALLEANVRWGNTVPINNTFLQEALTHKSQAVLGYSDRYNGVHSNVRLRNLLGIHHIKQSGADVNNKKLGLKKYGQYLEMESLPQGRQFSGVTFFKDQSRDDTFRINYKEYSPIPFIKK